MKSKKVTIYKVYYPIVTTKYSQIKKKPIDDIDNEIIFCRSCDDIRPQRV